SALAARGLAARRPRATARRVQEGWRGARGDSRSDRRRPCAARLAPDRCATARPRAMSPRSQPPAGLLDRPLAEAARRIALAELERAARARSALAEGSDPEALHDLRVALRRLRS